MLCGGGILVCAILSNLNAKELSAYCNNRDYCRLTSTYPLITNHGDFTAKSTSDSYQDGIYIETTIDLFVNYGSITTCYNSSPTAHTFNFTGGQQGIKQLINYGTLAGGVNGNDGKSIHIVNHGTMGGVDKGDITLTNYGVIKPLNDNGDGKKYHFGSTNLTLQTSLITINENASTFNTFSGTASDNSHLVLKDSKSAKFENGDSKIILDFGDSFEFGAGYLFDKLVVDTSGSNKLNVDFDRLMPKSDIYHITQQNDSFVVHLKPESSTIGNLYKSNVRTMNNFQIISNSMIYPRKLYHSQNLGRNISSLLDSALDSANHLKSYESFAYRNEAINRRIQRQNRRNYSRESLKTQNLGNSSLRADSRNLRGNPQNKRNPQNQRTTQNLNYSQTSHNYYFILTPFINHNYFFESGRYNLSGFDYGFLTAFSARVAESNSLGAHFMMSYGSLGDSKDKDLSIKSLNLNVGINYKLDLIWDMFVKARGDFFYFLNQAKTLTMFEAIKPNNLGFGASVSYGKEWDFKSGGVLGIEAGLDYKALKTNEVLLNSQTYKQSLYSLIYADLGLSYAKYFGGFGVSLGGGFRANLAPKIAESALIVNSQTLKFTLDNDKYLGYANAGISYALNAKSFDMEFSLAYYGNFGDRAISNAGGFEWRVGW